MSKQQTPLDLKIKLCEIRRTGKIMSKIYREDYLPNVPAEDAMAFDSFKVQLRKWTKRKYTNPDLLDAGTFQNFTAHNATVQIDGDGKVTQAWIKQKADDIDPELFIEAVREAVQPYRINRVKGVESNGLLEVPLFDMHFGIAFFEHYETTLSEILCIIQSKRWSKIVIPFGQDFFHNDSLFHGQTTKGTQIEKVDMIRAVKDGQRFMFSLIDCCIENADEVKLFYSPGNHDRSVAWMFTQVLLARYGPEIVDDAMEYRKVFTFGNNSVMVTHGDAKGATPSNLAHVFAVSFPSEFAGATIREVHAGHLHHEQSSDCYGVMVRRLSTANKTDEWTDQNDYVGTHKRFMLFEWTTSKLKAIYYVGGQH